MADETAGTKSERECLFCDIVWTGLALLAAAALGVIAADALLSGRVSEKIGAWVSPVVANIFTKVEAAAPAGGSDGE